MAKVDVTDCVCHFELGLLPITVLLFTTHEGSNGHAHRNGFHLSAQMMKTIL